MVLKEECFLLLGLLVLVQVYYTNTCFDNPLNKWTGMIDTAWNVSCNWTQNYIPAVDDNIIFDDVP
jgi:hypothetical protein